MRCRRASASMPSCLQGGGELLGRHTVDLVTAVGDEVEDEAHLAELLGEAPHLLVAHPGRVPVEGRRQVVGQHLLRELGVDRIGELAGLVEIRGLGLHPEDVGKRRRGERLGDGVGDAAAHLVVALGGLGVLAVPDDRGRRAPWPSPRPRRARRAAAKRRHSRGAHLERLALAGAELENLGDRLAVGLEAGLRPPRLRASATRPCRTRRRRSSAAAGSLRRSRRPWRRGPCARASCRRPRTPRRRARRAGGH